jgi:hypothetical protein
MGGRARCAACGADAHPAGYVCTGPCAICGWSTEAGDPKIKLPDGRMLHVWCVLQKAPRVGRRTTGGT